MGKNKKKSISKVIIASPLSNGSDNDEPAKSEELTTLSSPSNLSEEDLTTLVKIKLEPEPEILQSIEQKQDQTVEQTLEQSIEQTLEQKQDQTLEQTVEKTQEQSVEQTQEQSVEQTQEQVTEKELNEEINSENVELKEIKISNIETSSSPQKKSTGCSRGWCSIL